MLLGAEAVSVPLYTSKGPEAATARAHQSFVNPKKMHSVFREYWGGLALIFLTRKNLTHPSEIQSHLS